MTDPAAELVVSVYVFTDDPGKATKAAEVLARAVAGLGLDGIDASLRVGPQQDELDDTP